MKMNLIAVAVAAALVAPIASAEVTTFGDARVRYTSMAMDITPAAPATSFTEEAAVTTSRVRFGFKASEGNTMVTGRLKMTNGVHGDGVDATDGNVDVDYGYMSTKIGGMVDVAGGLMVANWGNKLLAWDARPNRVMLSTDMLNNVWMALVFDKGVENYEGNTDLGGNAKGDDDLSSMKVLVKAKIPTGEVGLLYAMDDDNRGDEIADPVGGADKSGTIMDVYYTGKVGPVAIAFEYASKDGKAYEQLDVNNAKVNPTGMMLAATMMAGSASITGMYVNVADGYQATKYLDPFSTVGTNQDTAIMDIGAGAGDTLSVFGVVAAMPINDALTIQGGIGMGTMDRTAATGTTDKGDDIQIIDLQAHYKVDAKTTIRASYGTVAVDDQNAVSTDADFTVMGLRMETKF